MNYTYTKRRTLRPLDYSNNREDIVVMNIDKENVVPATSVAELEIIEVEVS